MKGLVIFAAMSVQCFVQYQNSIKQRVSMVYQEESKGIWKVPEDERIIVEDKLFITSGNYLFSFDGTYATLMLIPAKGWVYRSADDIYKLKTKWEGNRLFYLPPFGEWTYLADFDGSRFTKEEQQHIWIYKKVGAEELENADKAILKRERPPHDYAITPLGQR